VCISLSKFVDGLRLTDGRCGLNGALYFVSMDEDGGLSKYSGNKAGAKYGTGYCDAQCPRDLKFINGEANSAQWTESSNDPNAGVGGYGSCCSEMDIWCVLDLSFPSSRGINSLSGRRTLSQPLTRPTPALQ